MKKKLIIFCIAVGLSLTLVTTTFAAPTLYLVDGDSHSIPWVVPQGTISFDGELSTSTGDTDFVSAGASGIRFDITRVQPWAELSWDFDYVVQAEFIYGGGSGNILVEARDIGGNVLDSFFQADTGLGQPAGPVILSGMNIRSLWWTDTSNTNDMAALDNITLTVIPAPGAILLGSIGVGFVGWLRRKRTL